MGIVETTFKYEFCGALNDVSWNDDHILVFLGDGSKAKITIKRIKGCQTDEYKKSIIDTKKYKKSKRYIHMIKFQECSVEYFGKSIMLRNIIDLKSFVDEFFIHNDNAEIVDNILCFFSGKRYEINIEKVE